MTAPTPREDAAMTPDPHHTPLTATGPTGRASTRGARRTTARTVAATAVVALALAACSGNPSSFGGGGGGAVAGDGGGGGDTSISVAMISGWDEDVAATYLWKELLEQRGYQMEIRELDVASTFTGVAQGQVDLYLDAWLPVTHEAYWKRFSNQLEVLSTWSEGKNLLAVPDYVPAKSISDLAADPAPFGGRIVGIEAGAGLMRATREQVIPQYGLSSLSLVEGSSAAMLAALDSAIKAKKAIVVTLWQPHWAFSRFPIRALEDPKGAFGKPDDIQVIATKGFSAEQPELAGWMTKFRLSQDQLASLTLALHNAGKGNEQAAAKEWLGQNKAVVDAWFAG